MRTNMKKAGSDLDAAKPGGGEARVEGRWIRPAGSATPPAEFGFESVDAIASELLREARSRVSRLAELERTLEERIRLRWQETETEMQRRLAESDAELEASRRRLDAEIKEARARAEKEGRAAGYREGFVRGREEGYRLGLEEGRREGLRAGREEEVRRVEGELSGAAAALASAANELQKRREELLEEAKRDLVDLAIEIAKRVVKREIARLPDVVLVNVKSALELIFRRGSIAIVVHPEDAPAVEKALASDPRWKHGFDCVEVRASADVSRGGCRLVSGAGSGDRTVETQLASIEAALKAAAEAEYGAPGEPPSPSEEAAP